MFDWNDKYNLSIDCELFGYLQDMEENPNMTVDDLHFTVLAMIGAIAIHNPYAPQVYTTLDSILITMAQDVNFKASPKIRTGIMNGFNTLAKYGAIEMDQLFTGDKKQLVCIKPHKLGHKVADENGETINYFQLSRAELATILIGSNTPHHLIAITCNQCSRFNGEAYDAFSKGFWNPGAYDATPQLFKKLSCWASQDTITSSWINSKGKEIKRLKNWNVTPAQFSRYYNQLIDLKIFDRIIIGYGRISHYFRPAHRECVAWSLELLAKEQAFVERKQQEQQEQEKSPDKKFDRKAFEQKLARLGSTVDYD
jgi:hypothetical protein